MPTKRIIPCLDVRNGQVVKGIKFRGHQVVGEVLDLARHYCDQGADELVFYDITASIENRSVDQSWVTSIAQFLDIPFCVAGGIRSREDAKGLLNAGADKISINSPALENPALITELAREFGSQCIVVGIDSKREGRQFFVYGYTGSEATSRPAERLTLDWVREVQDRGAGEVVLNCMDSDGVGGGYDLEQLKQVRSVLNIPLIASGGAREVEHFSRVFSEAHVDGALAASVFHSGKLEIQNLKQKLKEQKIEVRL